MHVEPGAQAAPHAPQLLTSVLTLVQPVEHIVLPGPHAQTPLTQTADPPQECPHAPQLDGSFARLTQADPQSVLPPAQTSEHCPDAQVCPPPHAFPHKPQFPGSFARFTHELPQSVDPPAQLVEHCPFEQTCPAPQALPHAPQFAASRERSFTESEPTAVVAPATTTTPLRLAVAPPIDSIATSYVPGGTYERRNVPSLAVSDTKDCPGR